MRFCNMPPKSPVSWAFSVYGLITPTLRAAGSNPVKRATAKALGFAEGFFEIIMVVTLREAHEMMYPFLTLDDGTEIVHSEMLPDARVKVYME